MAKKTDSPEEVTTGQKTVTIKAPNLQTVAFGIEGIAPYVQNAFSAKAQEMMRLKQEAGGQAKKGGKRDAKDFQECYEQAMHKLPDGSHGIPAPGIRAGMISACRTVDFKMTLAKLCLFVEADGYDVKDGTPLIRITKGQPVYTEMMVRNQTGVADIRARPMWREGWRATLRIRFDADKFSATDIANLVNRLGQQVGIGEGRPDSPQSSGLGWGLFKIINEEKAA